MRVAILILILCVASTAAAEPHVAAHLSKQDVRQIVAAVRAVTRKPIESIDPIYTNTPGLRSRPVGRSILIYAGTEREVTRYERTDQAVVLMESGPHVGGRSYIMHKVGSRWRIRSKSFWMR